MEQVITDPSIGTTMLTAELVGARRRRELAGFLRARRESLLPEAVGMPRTARRRVRGLRREEVAEAAGISTAWYTWIEQAREVNLSVMTLERIAEALRLDAQERTHLFALAGQPAPLTPSQQDESVLLPLRLILRGLEPNPAYVLDSQWRIVAWNHAAERVFGDLSALPDEERNYLKLIFTSPVLQELFVNWKEVAQCTLAHFRSDSASLVDDPAWKRIVDDLCRRSESFREWWPQHNVAWPYSWRKELRMAEGNRVFYSYDLELLRPQRLRIVTYISEEQMPR
ncbi:MAG TPA: helix-turn-helix transcriptional regulator [Edaphobacter sp.]